MKHIIVIFFILVIFTGFLFDSLDAMSWPSGNAVLVRNFGSNNRGKPVLGMVFAGGTDVVAAESGEVIFTRTNNAAEFAASRLPSPLGAWAAVDHGDGLISIYSRYANEPENNLKNQVERQQPVASAGISGWSAQNGFYFMIFDRRERRWINPAMIITPMQETRPVQILSVELRNAQGVVQSRNLTQGRYTVFVNAAGGTSRVPAAIVPGQFALHRIVCSVNGAEVGSLNFEFVSARDGVLMVSRNGLVPASKVYAYSPSFEAADVFLTRGQVTLEIIVQDITGSSRSVINRLVVN
ncbi:MAG: M23 family metallopeptidase [Treponema sp.]|nr:M23 family metallopeptidase [Treponema sp.]